MAYFNLDHVRLALGYMAEHTHPTLTSVLSMLRHDVPVSNDPADAVVFGSTIERRLMEDYFQPHGGPDDRPFFVPFGPSRGYTHWRDRNYAGRSLQRQRGERTEVFKQHPTDNKRWMFADNLASGIANTATDVVGDIPILTAFLAVWFYRDRDVASLEAAVADFAAEFHLSAYGLVPDVFSVELPTELSVLPLVDQRIDDGELLLVLQGMEPDKPETAPEEVLTGEAVLTGAAAKVHLPPLPPGDWSIPLADLGDLCGLEGLEEPATRALAALSAGMHVILTGPPGSGKTRLAECLCAKAGFPVWTVPATDQWTTFETIGGYFPTPKEGETGDRLDFLPGSVVDSLEKGRCLIIDEINRADIDKAFGELFTLLSGNTVTLPYRRRGEDGSFRRVRLQVGSAVVEDEDADVIVVPTWWRLVGSMNDADKASLKRMSMAFVRRFAFIPIDLPAAPIYEGMIQAAIAKTEAAKAGIGDMAGLLKVLTGLFARADQGLGKLGLPLGPAFPFAMIRHADSEWRLAPGRAFETVLASALELYVMPQLQGRPDLHDAAVQLFSQHLTAHADEFARHLAVWTGYVP